MDGLMKIKPNQPTNQIKNLLFVFKQQPEDSCNPVSDSAVHARKRQYRETVQQSYSEAAQHTEAEKGEIVEW